MMTKFNRGAQAAFLAAGALTVLEFIFIRGMFTWLIAVALVTILGALNIVLSCRDREWRTAFHYVLTTVALTMGYLTLA